MSLGLMWKGWKLTKKQGQIGMHYLHRWQGKDGWIGNIG